MKKILPLIFTLVAIGAQAQHNFKLPAYETVKLKNGLTLFLMEQHEVPLIQVHLTFDAGAIQDGEIPGLSSLTAQSLMLGTAKYTKSEIDQNVDFVGASMQTFADHDQAGIRASFASKDQDQLLALFKEVVTRPTFNEEEFLKNKERKLLELVQAKESPRSVIGNYFNAQLFPDFPYGSPVDGTPESLAPITTAQIRKFYETYYTTDHAALAIVGDFDSKKMKTKLTSLFGDWKTQPSRMIKRKSPSHSWSGNRVLLVNKEDARETTFLIGGKGIAYNSPDYVPIMVVNTILGGRFTSWLNDALRVNSGLTYGARSSFSRYKYGGSFGIFTFTKTATTVPAIDMALQVLDSLHTTGLNEEILASAKAYVKGDFPPNYESAGSLAQLLTAMYRFGFDETFINGFQQKVEQLDLKETKRIIKEYFPKDQLQFVLIGKSSEIREQVRKYGPITEREIKEDNY
ncbi:putative Zn-dependent peptidase [Dyadobacter jejuensis]|uniref:Putative Zn-dependent peptidase n=1 Tax=Dyadobacter jejuensis TaxID=1082580 RepID=A0A316ACZ9_9BACT|nr:pitrilysin family protein [Dyadobacter jejuensis]PWJ55613.1 putative Zn-dependent peptidase [Dyadobacter jejuensis]